jgi:hypothetical protein
MKKSICILLLVVSIIILLSGLTMSYFHDKSDKIQIPFTMGTLEVEITEFPGNKEDWKPGETKQLEWSFENVGSQPAKLRVKVEGEWDSEALSNAAVKWEMNASDWSKDGDYYLYNGTVDVNKEVSIGFYVWLDENSITLENYKAYEGAKYEITLTMEAIQADGSWE